MKLILAAALPLLGAACAIDRLSEGAKIRFAADRVNGKLTITAILD